MASFRIVLSAVFLFACLAGDTHAIRSYKDDLCTDVSFWDVVQYRTEDRCCDEVKTENSCVSKTEELCEEVTEMKCEATAWVECKPSDSGAKSSSCKAKYKEFPQKKCKTVTVNVPHKKKVPECKQVTKDNCITDWEVDENGNKVWAGKETCEPVTWEECKIVEKLVDFAAEKTECVTAAQIKYLDHFEETGNSDSLQHKCQVRKAVDCKPVKSRKCATVTYQECSMKPSSECAAPFTVNIPEQTKVHAKKCLT